MYKASSTDGSSELYESESQMTIALDLQSIFQLMEINNEFINESMIPSVLADYVMTIV
jgi:hypothetical protein